MIIKGFGSDNHAPVHPEILKQISEINSGHQPSYGTDPLTQEVHQIFKSHFGESAQVFFTFNGTATNVLALKAMCQSYQSVLCSDISHLNNDECGAPEVLSQVKLIPVPSLHGKINVDQLEKFLIRRGDQHYSQIKAVSITQPTEVGTLYSIKEIQEISEWCKKNRLLLHMDGARIGNAAYKLNKKFKEFTSDLGVDIVSFGGTKNGLMFGEALLILNPALGQEFKFYHKQFCQLPSKSRYIAAQFKAYFKNDLYLDIAKNSCDRALELYNKITSHKSLANFVSITQPVECNSVFVIIPQSWVKHLRKQHFFYVWNEHSFECRWMCSWDTHTEEIDSFVTALVQMSESQV